MAKFMMCHLANGLYDGNKLLRPDSAIAMRNTGIHGVPGVAIGFFERWINGRRCVAHTGLIWGYASQLLLYPDEKFGVYITLNSEEGGLYDQASNALMEAVFPETEKRDIYKLPKLPLSADENAINTTISKILCGTYRHTRYPRNKTLPEVWLAGVRARLGDRDPAGANGWGRMAAAGSGRQGGASTVRLPPIPLWQARREPGRGGAGAGPRAR